jgi:hypothetical protein
MPGETRRTDVWAIGLGVGFIAAYTAAIMVLGSRLAAVPHLSDTGPAWYYWKLAQPTVWTRLSAWVPYALHQLFVFGTIAWAQKQGLKYVGGLHRVNVVSLVGNAGFALLHLVQTHITYDGLAQDVHVFSALGSVAILLIWVLLMENPRRGLFLGKKVSFPRQLID